MKGNIPPVGGDGARPQLVPDRDETPSAVIQRGLELSGDTEPVSRSQAPQLPRAAGRDYTRGWNSLPMTIAGVVWLSFSAGGGVLYDRTGADSLWAAPIWLSALSPIEALPPTTGLQRPSMHVS